MELRPKHVAILDFLTLEEGTDGSSRNVRKELPLYAPQSRRRVQISSTWRSKAEIMQLFAT